MAFGLNELRRTLTGKLGMEIDTRGSHPVFLFRHDGRILAKTHISHGSGKDVSDRIISAMARQIGVTGPQLRDSISCRISGAAFAELVVASAEQT